MAFKIRRVCSWCRREVTGRCRPVIIISRFPSFPAIPQNKITGIANNAVKNEISHGYCKHCKGFAWFEADCFGSVEFTQGDVKHYRLKYYL